MRFCSFISNLLQGVMIKILYCRKDLVREKGIGKRHQNNSRIKFFFQNYGCLDYLWDENMKDRSGKSKKSEGCCWK